jgi:hypothetical protein
LEKHPHDNILFSTFGILKVGCRVLLIIMAF